MDVSVNLLAVVVAALSTMAVGSIWYGKMGFYKEWSRLAKVKASSTMTTKQMAFMYGAAFVASLVSAFVLAYFIDIVYGARGGSYLAVSLQVAFMGWLGFTAARLSLHDLFEGRRKKLTLLNVSHELVTFVVMAIAIGLIH